MAQHVFLTGRKQVGKSTLLRKILERYEGKIDGFLTVRTDEFLTDGYSVHMFRYGETAAANADNLLFVCGKQNLPASEKFDKLGCQLLAVCTDCSLLVMDELGPHEADAVRFREAVLRRLDGDIPILGVLQAPAEAFWRDIVKHPHVHMFEVTEENRAQEDMIARMLCYLVK